MCHHHGNGGNMGHGSYARACHVHEIFNVRRWIFNVMEELDVDDDDEGDVIYESDSNEEACNQLADVECHFKAHFRANLEFSQQYTSWHKMCVACYVTVSCLCQYGMCTRTTWWYAWNWHNTKNWLPQYNIWTVASNHHINNIGVHIFHDHDHWGCFATCHQMYFWSSKPTINCLCC